MKRLIEQWKTWKSVVILLVVFWFSCQTDSALSLSTLALADSSPEVKITIQIQNRKFKPDVLYVRIGQKTRLIFKNHDAELHAFVPSEMLIRGSFQISGTGFPEFTRNGLYRILIPPSGQTDILFVPGQLGIYRFFCNLPGHVMIGNVVVEA